MISAKDGIINALRPVLLDNFKLTASYLFATEQNFGIKVDASSLREKFGDHLLESLVSEYLKPVADKYRIDLNVHVEDEDGKCIINIDGTMIPPKPSTPTPCVMLCYTTQDSNGDEHDTYIPCRDRTCAYQSLFRLFSEHGEDVRAWAITQTIDSSEAVWMDGNSI